MEMVYSRYSDLLYITQSPRTELSIQKYRHRFTDYGNRQSGYVFGSESLEILRCVITYGNNWSGSRYRGYYLF